MLGFKSFVSWLLISSQESLDNIALHIVQQLIWNSTYNEPVVMVLFTTYNILLQARLLTDVMLFLSNTILFTAFSSGNTP